MSSFPWHSWCQFCRKTPNECSLPALDDLRLYEPLFDLAIKCFSGKSMRKRSNLPICPDCKEFLEQIQNFSMMYAQTHSIYAELRKKCQPEEYALDELEDAEEAREEAERAERLQQRPRLQTKQTETEESEKQDFFEIFIRNDEYDIAQKVEEEEIEHLVVIEDEEEEQEEEEAEEQEEQEQVTNKKQSPVVESLKGETDEECTVAVTRAKKRKKALDFECEECGQVCASTASLKRHISIHKKKAEAAASPEKARPFVCKVCDKRWATKGSLKEHMIIHSESRPFKCGHCPKLFKNQQRMRIHEDTHTETQYKCPICGLQLNTKRTLTMHMVVHSQVKKFKCEYCNNEFKRAKALKTHLVIHTGLRPYKCPFCDKSFANGSNCRSHKRKAHPEELAAYEAEKGPVKAAKVLPTINELKTNLLGKGSNEAELITIIPYSEGLKEDAE